MIRDSLVAVLRAALDAEGIEPTSEIVLERPRSAEHGDWSSNIALASAKAAGRNPRDLAAKVVAWINANPPEHVRSAEVAGPGFVNFRLADSWLYEVLTEAIAQGVDNFGRSGVGAGITVDVEFVSANPTGPLHAGHGRWAAYGDSLSRLLRRCGYGVTTEFYVNDRGTQIQNYAASLAARKSGAELPVDGYAGQYIVDWAAEMPAGADPLEWGLAKAHDYQADTLARMRVVFDRWSSEKELIASGAMDVTLADLRAGGHVYELDAATWLRTTDFGDDKDRVLIRGGGEPTYFMPDIAYNREKFTRGQHLITVLGADHHGYVGRMKSAVQALGHNADDLEILIGQNVVLMRAGVEVKLSKRTGDIVELAEVIDEVGPDATRFTYLSQSIDTRQVFDLEAVKQQSMDNPVFYVQYAHARVCSIAKQAAERGVRLEPIEQIDLSLLAHPRELELLRGLFELPDAVLFACRERAPHKVATWVRDFAGRLHGFYHDCYVMGDGISPELTQARLWLVEATRVGLVVGLSLLGVDAPEQM